MGSSSSKPEPQPQSWGDQLKANIKDEVAKQAMMQREIQLSINIAQARDSIQIFGPLWATLVSGVSIGTLLKKPVPHILFVPCVVGGIVLGNMADMAYGNKLQRVMREAEYIMKEEEARFVPPPQAPFAKYYSDEQRAKMYNIATPVGELFPSSLFSRSGDQ